MSINSSGNLVEMASYGKGQTRAFFVFFFFFTFSWKGSSQI